MSDASVIQYASALGPPIIALVVGAFGALIAYRQWRTGQNRLKLDLFDRRLVVYQQTRDFLACRMALGQFKDSEVTEFAINVRVSRWLFSPSIAEYLEGEIAKKAMEVSSLDSELETLSGDVERRKNLLQRRRELTNWLDKQLYEVIDGKFSEFLRLRH